MSAAVVIALVRYVVWGGHLTDFGVRQAISLFAIAVFAALSGKLAGLVWARWRLIRTANRLYDMVTRSASPQEGSANLTHGG